MDPDVLARPDRQLRRLVGLVDHPAHLHDSDRDPAAHVQGREVDAAAAVAATRDQVDPGALQGRQAAPAAGDHGLLPAREGEPAGFVPPAGAPDPVLHRAVPAAALAGVQGRHRRQSRLRPDHQPRRQGHRPVAARRVDRSLRRHAAGRQCRHGDERRPDAAPHHVRAAVRVRHLHRQLRGRSDRVLDHDQRVDDRPAAARQEALSKARPRGGGRGGGTGPRAREAAGPGAGGGRRAHRRPVEGGRRREDAGEEGEAAEEGEGSRARGAAGNGAQAKPPPSPRKKKKRSGRRR